MIEIRDGLAALALIVSGLSLFISWRTSQRAKAEKAVNAWIVLARANAEWWQAKLKVENKSHLGIELEKLTVDLPDYRLGDWSEVKWAVPPGGSTPMLDIPNVDHHLAMPFKFTVAAGETFEGSFLLHQPSHSRRKFARSGVMYWTLEPSKRWCALPVMVRTRSDL
jgi:hypothetical protein